MEITKEILENTTTEEVYNYLLPQINRLSRKYAYLNLSEEKVKEAAYLEIERSRTRYTQKETYLKYIMARIDGHIRIFGRELLNDANLAYDAINNYIANSFDNNEALDNLKKVSSMFKKYSYDPNPDVIIRLISTNQVFKEALDQIYQKYANYLKKGELEALFKDDDINMMIGIYCMINGISINTDIKADDLDDSYLGDSAVEDYLRLIKRIPSIKSSEMQELGVQIRAGSETARNRLVEGHLWQAVDIARKCYFTNRSIPLADLIQTGNEALIKVVAKYNFDLGYRFSTYAYFWILSEIRVEQHKNSRTISLPINFSQNVGTYKKTKYLIEQKKGIEATPELIAKEMKVPVEKVNDYAKYADIKAIPLNATINKETDTEILDMTRDQLDFDEIMEKKLLNNDIQRLFDICKLTKREQIVIMYRYGLIDGIPRSQEEIGKIFNCTREAVRQREALGLYKLRTYQKTEEFAIYMDKPEKALTKLKKYREAYDMSYHQRYKSNPLEDLND